MELTTIAIEATGRQINVLSATDGRSALAMLRNGHRLPALILLDLKMRVMNGIEVLSHIRADGRLGRDFGLRSLLLFPSPPSYLLYGGTLRRE